MSKLREKIEQIVTKLVNTEGLDVELDKLDFSELEDSVQDEYSNDFEGSVEDVIMDLNNTIGLDSFYS